MTEVLTCQNCGMSLTEGQREWCSSFCRTEYYKRTRNKFCQREGCDNPLTGKQKKFCSNKCRTNQYRKDNPECRKHEYKQRRERRQNDPEFREHMNKYQREYKREKYQNPEYRERNREHRRERYQEMRKVVLDFYDIVCNWPDCDNDNPIHLDIDHINDDGAEHKEAIKKIGRHQSPTFWVYNHIIKREPSPLSEDYGDRWTKREEFQLLCKNHNYEKLHNLRQKYLSLNYSLTH